MTREFVLQEGILDLETQCAALRAELTAAQTSAALANETAAASETEMAARHAAEVEQLTAQRDTLRTEIEAALAAHELALAVRALFCWRCGFCLLLQTVREVLHGRCRHDPCTFQVRPCAASALSVLLCCRDWQFWSGVGVQELKEKHDSEVGVAGKQLQEALASAESERTAVVESRAAVTAALEREGEQQHAREAAEERVCALEAELEVVRHEVCHTSHPVSDY